MHSLEDRDAALQSELDQVGANVQAWLDANEAEGIVCDFCAHLVPPADVITFLADADFTVDMHVIGEDLGTGTLKMVYEAPWAACPGCAAVVEAGDPVALAAHVMEHGDKERTGVPDTEEHRRFLVQLFEALYNHNPTRLS